MRQRPVDIWREKLDHLQQAEAVTSDPAQLFTIRKQIEEAQQKIAELVPENDSTPGTAPKPAPPAPPAPPEPPQTPPSSETGPSPQAASVEPRQQEPHADNDSRVGDMEQDESSVKSATSVKPVPSQSAESPRHVFRWLHLTDLHWGMHNQDILYPNVRQAFFKDLSDLVQKGVGPWDAVFFTGDLVYSGQQQEFTELNTQVLAPLWQHLRDLGSDPVLLATAGNHDLRWPPKKTSAVRQMQPGRFPEVADEFWNDDQSEYRQVVDDAFEAYQVWWADDAAQFRGDHLVLNGRLPGDFSTTLAASGGRRIGVVGLNTAFLQLDTGYEEGQLAWDQRQLQTVCEDDAGHWTCQRDACILLTHHGKSWLNEECRAAYAEFNPAGAPVGRFLLHLHGHMHENVVTEYSQGGWGPVRIWQGPSLFGLEYYGEEQKEDRRHGYTIGQIVFDDRGYELRMWPRGGHYHKVGGWHFEPDREHCNLLDDDGSPPVRVDLDSSPPAPNHNPGPKAATLQPDPPTSHESLDSVLQAYSEARLADWERAWTDPNDPDQLVYYVPPRYALLKPNRVPSRRVPMRFAREKEGESDLSGEDAYEPIEGETEEQVLANLLRSSDRICISEGPGAGKSIMTRRMQAFLCSPAGRDALFDGRPVLAVRWEDGFGSWPEDFPVALREAVEPFMTSRERQMGSQQIVECALEQGRVVLILDALDQVGSDERIRRLMDFLEETRRRRWPVRVVLTGRPLAVDERRTTLFRDPAWRFGLLEDFDVQQQYRYLYGPEQDVASDEAWKARPAPDPVRRLIPAVGSPEAEEEEDSLRSLFQNYDEIAELVGNPAVLSQVREIAEQGKLKSFERRCELYSQTSYAMLHRAMERMTDVSPDPPRIARMEAVLAAIACEMMVHDPSGYRTDGQQQVARLRAAVDERISGGITDDEWRAVEHLTDLTNRSLLYGVSHDVLAWHHKGIMEFYCGLHLARNRQPGWCGPDTTCGDADVRRAATHPDWYWPFRFAIEMNAELRDPSVLLASLSTLFAPVDHANGHLRPTELIYRAWSILEKLPPHEWPDRHCPEVLSGGRRIIERFRAEFPSIHDDSNHVQNATARELLASFVECPSPEYVRECGADRDPCEFMMGAADSDQEVYDDERPRHKVRVSPFQVMSTPVTRQQYALFDTNYERHIEDGLSNYSPEPNCPAIYVSWYDSWCFARWLGADYRMPTEAQWEFACRAGKDGERDRFHFGDSLSTKQANFSRGDIDRTSPVGQYPPNAWEIYDMHGNVWEWCSDWFDEEYYQQSPPSEPVGPVEGSDRVRRGGSWNDGAGSCRSAFRLWDDPGSRDFRLGFRLVRSSGG